MRKKSAYYHYKSRSTANPVLGVFLLLIVGLAGFFAWRLLPDLIKANFGKYDRFNMAIGGKQVMLVSLNEKAKSLVIVKLPNDLYIPSLVHGYGQYKVSSVYKVGELDKRGGETLIGTLKEYLGFPVDAFFVTDNNFTDSKAFLLSPDFLFKQNTNLNFIDRVKFTLSILKVRFDKVKIINLESSASPLVLADGSNALSLDSVEIDRVLQGQIVENQIQDENYRIEVINSTDANGLGAKAVRLLTNIGLSVINVESSNERLENCLVLAADNAYKSLTVQRILNIYNCKLQKKATEERAAITVKLGQSYADFLTK